MLKTTIDPMLAEILGINALDANDAGEPIEQEMDPIGAFLHERQFGIPADGAKRGPRAIEEIEKSLHNIRAEVAERGSHSERFRKFGFPLDRMAASAEAHLEEGSPVTAFLKAASEGSDAGMRAAIRTMILLDGPIN